ncbi:sensor histidine kinase [Microbispora bryophytorum]|uniref:sensor histidine kinase n=1 Tax=Microbispora bryophytorum TaxID=1460882 RepID=UPI00340B437C
MNLQGRFSITSRITLFTGVVATLLCALLALLLMMAVHQYASETVTKETAAAGGRVAVQMERGQLVYPLAERTFRHLQVVDPSGRVVASTSDIRGLPRMAPFTPHDSANSATCVVCGGIFPAADCYIVVGQWAHRAGERWMVYSASPVVPLSVDPRLATLVGLGAVALAAAITYLGYRNVRASLKPVNAIRAELDEINEECPSRRVPVPATDDEIHRMAESVNHTLSRLDDALRKQREFVSNASHDLRTPIAAMRAEVEDGLLAPEETSVCELGSVLLPSIERLQAIVHDLLILERLDQGMRGEQDWLDLAEVAAAELRTRRHPAKRIECALQPGALVRGDRVNLARLLTNLLDNAERHACSTITVSVRHEPGGDCGDRRYPQGRVVLEVVDDGPGIARDKREMVFDRFTRLDSARSRDAGGAGLGLAIARQIAESHGGSLTIEDNPIGACFVLCLPSARADVTTAPADDSVPS